MEASLYMIKPNPKRHNALFDGNGIKNRIILVSVGIVTFPPFFNNSKKENPFNPGDLAMIVAGVTKLDLKKYPWLFTKGEYCPVMDKLLVDGGDKYVNVFGVRQLNPNDYICLFSIKGAKDRKRKKTNSLKNKRVKK